MGLFYAVLLTVSVFLLVVACILLYALAESMLIQRRARRTGR